MLADGVRVSLKGRLTPYASRTAITSRVPSNLDEESLKFERIIHHFLKFDVDTGRTYSTKRHSERGVKKETRETSVESGMVTENTGHRVDVY